MKTILSTIVIILVCSTNIFASQTFDKSKEYQITQVDSTHFSIEYTKTKLVLELDIKTEKKQTYFLVHSNSVEVMYFNNKRGFGLRKIPTKWKTINTNYNKLNTDEFNNQALITSKQLTTQESLEMIASFFPDVKAQNK